MAIPAKILDQVVAEFKADKHWHFGGKDTINRIHRHMGFFVRRRADKLGTDNSSWLTESDLHLLKGRIGSEFDALIAYLESKLGASGHRGPLYGGPGDASPPHLDVADLAQRKVSERAGDHDGPGPRPPRGQQREQARLRQLRDAPAAHPRHLLARCRDAGALPRSTKSSDRPPPTG